MISFEIPSEEDMEALGRRLGPGLPSGSVVLLVGDLGAGKTTLVRGILRGLGHEGTVTSPTYTLVELYDLPGKRVCHFDLYRLEKSEELVTIGLRDMLDGQSLIIVEWPERGRGYLPDPTHEIEIQYNGKSRTVIVVSADGLEDALA